MIENEFVGIFEDSEGINFDKISNIEVKSTKIKKDIIIKPTIEETEVIEHYSHEYISNLKENYEAEEVLFDNLEDLINESEDQELLMKILDSL